jgi:2-dehydro-3-deoxyphosphogluconate aldolase/(4S)-4-hydroxy-2-oxoglutarate aldolase
MGGAINIAEITLTVPNATSIIKELSTRYGDNLLVGAGTVLDPESCRQALLAGAEFIVSPTFDANVVTLARQHGKVCMPGALTPTEVLAAWRGGADLVKVFPCSAVGGPSYVRALKGPFPDIEFVVTGGVNRENISQFLTDGATAVGVGESVMSPTALASNNASAISANASALLEVIRAGRAKA